MKIITKTTVAAIALIGVSAPALADCPGAGQTFANGVPYSQVFTPSIGGAAWNNADNVDFFDTGSKTDSDCFTSGAVSFGTGVAVSGEIVQDQNDPDAGAYVPPETRAYGPNSTALGANAQVLKTETYTDPGPDGILGDDPNTVADESLDDFQSAEPATKQQLVLL